MTIESSYLPIPRRWPWKSCGGRCPPKIKITNDQGITLAGNMNLPTFELTCTGPSGKYPTIIRTAFDTSNRGSVNCASRPQTRYLSRQVNIFGRWAGAPGGSGKPPSNF